MFISITTYRDRLMWNIIDAVIEFDFAISKIRLTFGQT